MEAKTHLTKRAKLFRQIEPSHFRCAERCHLYRFHERVDGQVGCADAMADRQLMDCGLHRRLQRRRQVGHSLAADDDRQYLRVGAEWCQRRGRRLDLATGRQRLDCPEWRPYRVTGATGDALRAMSLAWSADPSCDARLWFPFATGSSSRRRASSGWRTISHFCRKTPRQACICVQLMLVISSVSGCCP